MQKSSSFCFVVLIATTMHTHNRTGPFGYNMLSRGLLEPPLGDSILHSWRYALLFSSYPFTAQLVSSCFLPANVGAETWKRRAVLLSQGCHPSSLTALMHRSKLALYKAGMTIQVFNAVRKFKVADFNLVPYQSPSKPRRGKIKGRSRAPSGPVWPPEGGERWAWSEEGGEELWQPAGEASRRGPVGGLRGAATIKTRPIISVSKTSSAR